MPQIKRGKYIKCEVCSNKKYFKRSQPIFKHTFCGLKCYGKFKSKFFVGSKAPGWKGGKTIMSGYIAVFCPEHKNALKSGYILEHRLVASKKIGRLIEKFEDVHHIDGNKQNNNPKNLEVMTHGEHSSHHKKGNQYAKKTTNRS